MEIQREGEPSYSVTQQQWTGQLPVRAVPAAAAGRIPDGKYVCYPDPNDWGDEHAILILSGNTFKQGYSGYDVDNMVLSSEGTYTAQNGILTLSSEGNNPTVYKYTLAGNTLTLIDVNNQRGKYTRVTVKTTHPKKGNIVGLPSNLRVKNIPGQEFSPIIGSRSKRSLFKKCQQILKWNEAV
jgi:hypothetical protein